MHASMSHPFAYLKLGRTILMMVKENLFFRGSLERLQIDQIGIGQLHWSTANYAPFQEQALWDGLVAMYDKVMQ